MTTTATQPPRSLPWTGSPVLSGPLLSGPLLVWAALWMNLLAYLPLPTLLPIPGPIGQMITQGSLWLALLLVLLANPAMVIRPGLVMSLLTLLTLLALLASLHSEFLYGSVYRAVRLLVFVLVLWLLTPWWGRRDMILVHCHLTVLRVILGTVAVGALLAPGKAFSFDGRLTGALWPIPAPQVAHYSATLLGVTVALWLGGAMRGRTTLITVAVSVAALIGAHTRTAILGVIVGLVFAALSLFVGHARVRRTSGVTVVVVTFVAITLGPLLQSWALRGQSTQEASQLTGRTKVWAAVFHQQRSHLADLFGSGLSNKSFNGLAIDSNWVAAFQDQGWAGFGLDVVILLVLLLLAITFPRGPRRAAALFLIVYCIVASFTETGLSDASPYILDLVLAASLLASRPRASRHE